MSTQDDNYSLFIYPQGVDKRAIKWRRGRGLNEVRGRKSDGLELRVSSCKH